MSKLTKPARVGNTIFDVGVDESTVIARAQREYEYRAKGTSPSPAVEASTEAEPLRDPDTGEWRDDIKAIAERVYERLFWTLHKRGIVLPGCDTTDKALAIMEQWAAEAVSPSSTVEASEQASYRIGYMDGATGQPPQVPLTEPEQAQLRMRSSIEAPNVKRYIVDYHHDTLSMREYECGDWVRWEDVCDFLAQSATAASQSPDTFAKPHLYMAGDFGRCGDCGMAPEHAVHRTDSRGDHVK